MLHEIGHVQLHHAELAGAAERPDQAAELAERAELPDCAAESVAPAVRGQ